MDLEELGFSDMNLSEGEHLHSTLNLENGESAADGYSDVILLTSKRVIHLNANGKRREAVFLSLSDIDSVEVASERRGYGAFVWGGLAFFVAIMLWNIWDHQVGRVLGAAGVASMGVYLIMDHLLSPPKVHASFRTGSSLVRFGLKSAQASKDIYAFVNQLFQLKDGQAEQTVKEEEGRRPTDFAPR